MELKMKTIETDYIKYRGKCKEMSEALIKENPELRLVRGYYYEPLWNREEQHWWCEDKFGNIIDPTAKQFPSGGITQFYREFDGTVECEECGKTINEADVIMMGRFPVCSSKCACRLVGL